MCDYDIHDCECEERYGKKEDPKNEKQVMDAMPCAPKIIQLLLTPNDSNWQGMLLGLADNGDTYRLDHADGWVIWFDGISQQNAEARHAGEDAESK